MEKPKLDSLSAAGLALYRVTLKRALRRYGVAEATDETTERLEEALLALPCPLQEVFAAAGKLFGQAVVCWTTGNNSGDNATLAREERECRRLQAVGELLIRRFAPEVVLEWPGLYPSYHHPVFGEHISTPPLYLVRKLSEAQA